MTKFGYILKSAVNSNIRGVLSGLKKWGILGLSQKTLKNLRIEDTRTRTR